MTNNQARTRYTTGEERKAQAEGLQASIADQVRALRNSAQWQRFLAFAGSFHQYSLNNLLLILAQRPDATAVAGYRAWQAKGRQVRAGEHGIHIFGYRQQTIEADTDDTDLEAKTQTKAPARTITRYPIVTVFDITQTDLIDTADDASTIAQPLTGTDDHGITAALTTP